MQHDQTHLDACARDLGLALEAFRVSLVEDVDGDVAGVEGLAVAAHVGVVAAQPERLGRELVREVRPLLVGCGEEKREVVVSRYLVG